MDNMLLFHKLEFLHEMFEKHSKRESKKSVTRGQGRILAILNRKDGLSTKELSEILDIRVTSLNESLNKLEKGGYIVKVKSDLDKRVLLVMLTDKGRNFRLPEPCDLDVFDCLTSEEKIALNDYLTRLTEEFHIKLRNGNPERFEKMINHRREIMEKYFNGDDVRFNFK